ncbi:MAG: hypothetical protein HJJLKODD_00547 [Phycisphaerae bacterium]|nr:hypothetical protein [Phycisphaerae bacterium]
MSTATEKLFIVEVTEDRMTATLRCARLGGYSGVTPGELAAVLEGSKIAVTDEVAGRITALAEQMRTQGPLRQNQVIASGKLPTEGHHARFVWDDALKNSRTAPWIVDSYPDFYQPEYFLIVEAGAQLGQLHRREDAHDGYDVLGNTLPAPRQSRDLTLGSGLQAGGESGLIITATQTGMLEICNWVISLKPVQRIDEDLTSAGGPHKQEQCLRIRGSIQDQVELECAGSVVVEQGIKAAIITAGGHVIVGEGIDGRQRARIATHGMIVSRFAQNCQLKAKEDIRLLTALENSITSTEGMLNVAQGTLSGGQHYARNGISAKTIGHESAIPTVLRVGLHPDVLRFLMEKNLEIAHRTQSVERIRQLVEPLMAQMKRLTPQQRERATELLYQADGVESEIRSLQAEQQKVINRCRPDNPPYIEAESRIYPGTTLCINEFQFVVDQEIRGPIRIHLQTDDRQREQMMSVNKMLNSKKALPAKTLTLDQLKALTSAAKANAN